MELYSALVSIRIVAVRTGRSPLDELVVPLDGSARSHRAMPTATAVAGLLGARLRLLTTLTDVDGRSPTEYLEDVVGSLDVDADTEVVFDERPAVAVAAVANAGRVGVCMATHARGRLLAGVQPNVADEVIARVEGPVFLVGPHCRSEPPGDGPVLLAHDGTPEVTARSAGLVELASSMRRNIEVMSVVSAPSGRPIDDPYPDERGEMAALCDHARRLGVDAESRLVFAAGVRDGIVDEATRSGASFVAMVAHPRGRLERVREGSVTMGVVHDATVPVVVAGSVRS